LFLEVANVTAVSFVSAVAGFSTIASVPALKGTASSPMLLAALL
jgi:hypothetical protein